MLLIHGSFSWDLSLRVTFWSCLLGGTAHWIGNNATHQAQIQRFFALNTLRKARAALWIYIGGSIFIKIICVYNGLLLYATYYDCDPLTTKLARAKDQMLPLLVMETLGQYPGLPGMFIAGIFSAALSSLSTGLNSLACVIYTDFIKPLWPDISEKSAATVMRFTVIVFGLISIALAYVVEHLGAVLPLAVIFSGISLGPLFGMYGLLSAAQQHATNKIIISILSTFHAWTILPVDQKQGQTFFIVVITTNKHMIPQHKISHHFF